MEASAALSTTLRVGVQIVLASKRPSIEIYHETINREGPEVEFDEPGREGKVTKHRFSHQEVVFRAINIGGSRAEKVQLRIGSGFDRGHGRTYGDLFKTTIPFVSAGQAIFLFRIDVHEFNIYKPEGGSPTGMKTEPIRIKVMFNGPWQGVNRILRIWSHVRKRPQFTFNYEFNPQTIYTDFPPVTYT